MNVKGVFRTLCLTRRSLRAAQVVMIVLALIMAAWPAHVPAQSAVESAATASPGQASLAELLDAEGRLNLSSGFRGSIDASGWQLVSGPNEAPAFAPLAVEEGHRWSGMFHPPGMTDGDVYALAVDRAGNLYAGGFFTAAGSVAATPSPSGMATPGLPWAAG